MAFVQLVAADDQTRECARQNFVSFARNTPDNFCGGWNVMNQASILTH